jgi:hypothetical protein
MSRRLVQVLSLALATLAVVIANVMGWASLTSKVLIFVVTFLLVYVGVTRMQKSTSS